MAYPPTVPPPNRTDGTEQFGNHPADHNELSEAITEIVSKIGNPSGTVQTALDAKLPKTGGTVTGALTVDGLITGNNGIETNDSLSGGSVTSNGQMFAAGFINSGPSGAPATNYGSRIGPKGQVYCAAGDDLENLGSVVLHRGGLAGANGQNFITFWRGVPWGSPATVGAIDIGSSTSVRYLTTSDQRLKTKTGEADDALDVVSQLGAKVYKGVWTGDEGAGVTCVFLNSQDAEPLVPFAVSGPPDGDVQTNPQQLNHSGLVPLLLAAVSQLAARVTELEANP